MYFFKFYIIVSVFRVLGLCNNFAYVIMLSAAKDILEMDKKTNLTSEAACIVRYYSFIFTILFIIAGYESRDMFSHLYWSCSFGRYHSFFDYQVLCSIVLV